MRIPKDKQWTQFNEGPLTGVLRSTRNLAFDTIGQAKLSKRPVAVMSSSDNADYGFPVAIVYFDNNYTVITEDRVFQGDLDGGAFIEETSFTPAATLSSDAVVFNDLLIVSLDDNFARWNGGGSINYSLGSLTSGVPHPMCIFDSLTTYKLAIGNGNQVKTYDTSYNANPTTLSLPSQFTVTTMRYRNGYLYVGTKTDDGTEARIFIWNGSGSSAQYEVPVGAEWVFSMTEYGSTVAAVTSSGQLLQVAGSSAQQLAAFPVYYDPHARWQGSGGLTLNGKVFNRGMIAVGSTIYINVDGELDTGFIPEMQSGLWVFDPDMGLYHRASTTTDLVVRDTDFTVTDSTITTAAAHNLKTGDAVQFTIVSGLSGISDLTPYYVTVVDSDSIKLSVSREALVAERYVTITGTVDIDTLCYFPNTDQGFRTATSGAITLTTAQETPLEMLSSEVIWGGRSEAQDGSTTYVLNAFHDSNSVGLMTTTRIYSSNIEDTWKSLHTMLDGIVTDEDKIIVKVQTTHQAQIQTLSGTWADTTTFNTTDQKAGDIAEGDELVFTEGQGQGRTAHVTNIEASSSTYSITLDEAFGSTGVAATCYATNYKKVGEYSVDVKEQERIEAAIINKHSPWISIKCELRGAGTAVNHFILENTPHKQ